jgi:DNA modification methylase
LGELEIENFRPCELDDVTVEYINDQRIIKCFCGESLSRSIVPHFKTKHANKWHEWAEIFIKLRENGYPLKRIMRLFKASNNKLLFSWTVIERTIRKEVEIGNMDYTPPKKKLITEWNPTNFKLEETTFWDFPKRGDWSVHSGDYRGNWPPQIPRNLIERYTTQGDIVIDAFVGGGTTMIETWLLERRGIGLDISEIALKTITGKLKEMEDLSHRVEKYILNSQFKPVVIKRSALDLSAALYDRRIELGITKLICAHPPYLDSLKYTVNNSDDISLIHDPNLFYSKMHIFAKEVKKVLCTNGVLAILIGDVKSDGITVPLGFRTLEVFIEEDFKIENIVVKTQHKDRSHEFYLGNIKNHLLMAHEYLFVLKK